MRRHLLRSLAVAIGLAAAATPGSAIAATQVGQTFPPIGGCTGNTSLQSSSPNGQYTVPSAGVITAFSFEASDSPPMLEFKVARPVPGNPNAFTIIGETDLKVPLPSQLNTYTDVQIPVEPGDVIGAFHASGMTDCATMASNEYGYHSRAGDQPLGSTETYSANQNVQLDISATLEPDCDADELGDETQDDNISSCHPRTLTLAAGKKRVKKGTKVLFSGQLNEAANEPACESGQTVELQRKRPKQATFVPFDHVTTFASGDFATDVGVRKTYQYRAQVPETALCAAQVSGEVKVKVKKKKRKKGKKK
jgi:hypothetical protein